MKKKARILSLLLSVAMVFGLMVVPVAAEENVPTVTVAAAAKDLVADETFELKVTVANNSGFAGFTGNVKVAENIEFVGFKNLDNGLNFQKTETTMFALDNPNAIAGDLELFVIELKALTAINAADVDVTIIDGDMVDELATSLTVTYVGSKVATTPPEGEGDENPAGGDNNQPTGEVTPEGNGKDDTVNNNTDVATFCETAIDTPVIEGEVPEALKKAAGENAEFYNVVLNVTECKAGLEEEPDNDSTPNQPTDNTPVEDGSDTDVDGDTTTPNSTPNQTTGDGNVDTDTDTDNDTIPTHTPNQPTGDGNVDTDTDTDNDTIPTSTPNGDGKENEKENDTDVDHSNCVTRPATADEVAAYVEENGGIEVTPYLPKGVSAETHTIKILALINGEVAEVKATVADGKVTFTLDGLYPVALCWTEIVVDEDEPADEPEEETKTEPQMIMPRLLPVNVTVEEGAKVNTSAKFAIAYGARRTIKITVEEGYEVADIIVNGKSVGAADSYTLKGVTKATTIVIKTVEVVEEAAE